MRYQTRQIEIV
jgi:ATP-binding cassette subfamily C (CFTR/MRP) protein 1